MDLCDLLDDSVRTIAGTWYHQFIILSDSVSADLYFHLTPVQIAGIPEMSKGTSCNGFGNKGIEILSNNSVGLGGDCAALTKNRRHRCCAR